MTRAFAVERVAGCPVCGSRRRTRLFAGNDDRYGHEGVYGVVECATCGLAYLEERPVEHELGEFYRLYYPAVALAPSAGRQSFVALVKARLRDSAVWGRYQRLVNPSNVYAHVTGRGVDILDVGSGAALAGARWASRRLGASWVGLDLNPDVSAWAAAEGFEVTCRTLEDYATNEHRRFDYILMNQVIEHVYRPGEFLAAARALLKDFGRVIVSCPNYDSALRLRYGRKWLHWHVPYHVSHFTPRSLAVLARRAGLGVERWATVTPIAWYRAQQAVVAGARFTEVAMRTPPLLQMYLNVTLRRVNRSGRGDAMVAVLRADGGETADGAQTRH